MSTITVAVEIRRGEPMRGILLLAGFLIVIVGVVLAVVWPHGENRMERASEDDPLDPLLQALLKEPTQGDRGHQSRFFTTLLDLARKHGTSLLDAARTRSVDEGYAVRVGAGRGQHVVAVLRGNDPFIPGNDTQYLLLLNAEGRLLDTLSCSINNRLTRMLVDHSGTFRTDVPKAPRTTVPNSSSGSSRRGAAVSRAIGATRLRWGARRTPIAGTRPGRASSAPPSGTGRGCAA
jgi:hypothetical protein